MTEMRSALLILTLAVVSGCATSRGVIDVPEAVSTNPPEGVALKLERVTDERRFEIDPRSADIPSLKNDEIDNPAITSRAIARKRNSYGKALGDILLPEGTTVTGLVAAGIKRGLRENGYRVLEPGDAAYEDAVPLEVDIEKFWGWFSPGFWSVGPFIDGQTFDSKVERRFQAAGSKNWQTTIAASLDALNEDIAADLAAYRDTHAQ